jgi:hypothetical protein
MGSLVTGLKIIWCCKLAGFSPYFQTVSNTFPTHFQFICPKSPTFASENQIYLPKMIQPMTKTLFPSLSPLFCLFFLAFSFQLHAQVAGTKPELIMYRYNSNLNGPSPVLNGDTLGTIRFRGLSTLGNSPTGAAIRGIVNGPVTPGFIFTDLVFMTGSPVLQHRMVVKNNGLVGIGTMDPQYHLHVVGNTHTSGDFFGRIHFDKNLSTDDAPLTYIDEAYFETKSRSLMGVPSAPGVGNTGGVLTMAPGANSFDHQLFMGDDGMYTRRKTGNASDWSGAAWHKLLTGEDINGTPNRLAKFTAPNSLGDSQLWDDGAHIGIGTSSPAAAYLLDINGKTRVNAALDVAGATALSGSLSVSGTAQFSDRVGINTAANPAYRLDVGGDVQAERMAIGAELSGAHKLSVGGSVVAEEVKVALQANWPDYVFDAPTPNPADWARFIAEHKHLPGIPSAAEVQQNGGFNLGETQRLLLEKIEQLSLMLIAQQQQIETLQQQLEKR